MKTPREILLARHQSVTPKLDAIRQSAVAAVYDRRSSSPTTIVSNILKTLWHELILPSRRIWAGLAAIWILLFVANFSMHDHSQAPMAKASSSPEIILSSPQQEELLTELIGPDEAPVAEPQKPYVPRPSSQRFPEIVTT
jgi:hypothetical protein